MSVEGVIRQSVHERLQRVFWISTYPFFETVLAIVPAAGMVDCWNLQLDFYDPDGAHINSVQQQCSGSAPTLVDLDQFLGGCKLESGFKHAQLIVSAPAGTFLTCRLHSREVGSLLGPVMRFMNDRAAFYPVTFATDRSYLVALTNFADVESTVRCRLMCGKRAPEVLVQIPARGSRIVSLASTFPQFALQEGAAAVQGYVRLTTRSEAGVGAQLIERTEIAGGEGYTYGGVGL